MTRTAYEPLRAPILWFRVRTTRAGGRSCREYNVLGDDGTHLLDARAFTWGRRLEVVDPDGAPFLAIVRSRAFAFTGRATVHGATPMEPIGRVSRNGTITTPSGAVIGRYRDARSLGVRARLSLAQGLFESVLNSGDTSAPSGPDTLVLESHGAVGAVLSYVALAPGGEPTPTAAPAAGSSFRARIRSAWSRLNAPRGWKLVRSVPPADDPRLDIAAALFAAELSRW